MIAIGLAALEWIGLAGWLAAVVLLASVGRHVAGNSIGTRLRQSTDDRLKAGSREDQQVQPLPRAMPSILERRLRLGKLIPISAGIGGVCGGISGTLALAMFTTSSTAGTLLGGASSAVIGAIASFLLTSFIDTIRSSVREAIAAERGGLPEQPHPQ